MATPPRAPANPIGAPYVELTTGTGTGFPPVIPAPYPYTPLGYQQITSLATSTALTVPTGATLAVITVETNAVRYRDDGVAPTSSVGMILLAGTTEWHYSGSLANIRFIGVSGNPVLNVSYYS